MAKPGTSTLGALFGYAVETTAGTKPTAFTQLTRINQIGGINIETETIDASALEDLIEKTVSGRGSTGGTFSVTVNATEDTIKEWEDLISAYQTAKPSGKSVWFNTYFPGLNKSWFVVAEPPNIIPQPDVEQNSLLTIEMTLTINDYKGPGDGIEPEPKSV